MQTERTLFPEAHAPAPESVAGVFEPTAHVLLESITDAFFTLDTEWRFRYVNAQAERVLRRRREDLLGRHIWAEFPKAVGGPSYREYSRAVADGITVAFEEFYPPLSRWFDVKAYPSLEGLSVIFRDATAARLARDRTDQLLAVSVALGGALTAAQVADVILQAAMPIFQASMGRVALLSEDGRTLRTERFVGAAPPLSGSLREIPVDSAIPLAVAVRERRLVLLPTDQEQTDGHHGLSLTRAGKEGEWLAVPLMVADRCVGGLVLLCPPEQGRAEAQQTFLWTLAGQCALSLERARLYDAERWEAQELLRATDALAAGEKRLSLILDNVTDIVFLLGVESEGVYRFLFANPPFLASSGLRKDQVVGRLVHEVLPESVQDLVLRKYAEAIRERRPVEWEGRSAYPTGERVGEVRVLPILDAQDRVTHLLGTIHDITERRQIEAELRESQGHLQAIAEATPASIVITRLSDGAVLYANPFARQLVGVPADADVSRLSIADIYRDPAERAETVRLLSLDSFVGPRELAIRRSDGTPVWAMGSFQRLTYRGEEVVLATHHDITERKLIEAEKERLLTEAQERADRDPLTELFNHRAFHRRLQDAAERDSAPLAVVMLDLDNFKFFNDVYGHAVGDEVLRQVAERLRSACRREDVLARYGGDEFALLLPHVGSASRDEIEADIRARVGGLTYLPVGQIAPVPITITAGAATFPFDDLPWQGVVSRADERLRRAKTSGAGESEADQVRTSMLHAVAGFSMLDALVAAVDNKDRYTRRHSEGVLDYSLQIAQGLGMDAAAQHMVAVAALLHDVGKIGVPDHILRKPGALTAEEYAAIKQHPQMGHALVSTVPGLEDTLGAVRHHHERWDGGGYPDGLAGEETPLIARLMAVADAFSAMTTDRPYRTGMPPAAALETLQSGAGTQWDPECVRAFVHAFGVPGMNFRT